jgi:hypothetical protein
MRLNEKLLVVVLADTQVSLNRSMGGYMKTAAFVMAVLASVLALVAWQRLNQRINSVDEKQVISVAENFSMEKASTLHEPDAPWSVKRPQPPDNNRGRMVANAQVGNIAHASPSPPTIDELLEGLVLQAEGDPPNGLHSRLLDEDRDQIWAPTIESRIQSELANISGQTDDWVDVPYIECRATLCEIRAVGGEREWRQMPEWQDKLLGTDWVRQQFPNAESRMGLLLDGRAGYVIFLVREQNPPTE